MKSLFGFGSLFALLLSISSTPAMGQYDILQPVSYVGQARSDVAIETPNAVNDPAENVSYGILANAPSGATILEQDNVISFLGSGDSRLILGAVPGTQINGTASVIYQGSHMGSDICSAFKHESAISWGHWQTDGPGDQLYGLIFMAGLSTDGWTFSQVIVGNSWVVSENGWLSGEVFTRDENDNPGVLRFGIDGAPPLYAPGGIVVEVYEGDPGLLEAVAATSIGFHNPGIYNQVVSSSQSAAYTALVTVENNLPTPMGIPWELQGYFTPTGNGGGAGGGGGGFSGGF